MWFVSRRRYEEDLAAAKAEADRLRGERDDARAERDVFRTVAASAAEKFTDTHIVNACLTEDLTRARRRVGIARKAGARILAAYQIEQRRADRLQGRFDDACGLSTAAIQSRRIVPAHPVRGASS